MSSGTASAVETSRVRAHLQGCGRCRERAEQISRPGSVSATIRGDPAHTPVSDPGSTASAPPISPARLGRYRIIKEIGRGGMATVYAAHDDELDRSVALKLFPTLDDSAGQRSRVAREARAIAKLSHPNVVSVFDVGMHGDGLFIAMELADAGTMRAATEGGKLDWRRVLELYRGAGAGLAAAHAVGLVHRDFKPDNVLLAKGGRAMVADFGLARVDGHDEPVREDSGTEAPAVSLATTLTESGIIMGTPAYMAPEQMEGLRADARSDIFSFCVSLYEALYGERPFEGRSLDQLRRNILSGKAKAGPTGTSVPAWLRAAVIRGLQPRPEDRYPSVDAMLSALRPRGGARAVAFALIVIVVLVTTGAGVGLARRRTARIIPVEETSGAVASAPSPFEITTAPEKITNVGDCAEYPFFADDGSLVFGVKDGPRTRIVRMPKGTREVVPIVEGDDAVDVINPSPAGPGRVLFVRGKHLADDATLHSVALDGSDDRLEVRGTHGWSDGEGILYVRNDLRAIRRRIESMGVDETLFEAPSGKKFFDIVASPDGAWAATSSTNLNAPESTSDLCFGPIGLGLALDCTSGGRMLSGTPTFAPTSEGLYIGRPNGAARFDLATKKLLEQTFPPGGGGWVASRHPVALAIAPDGTRLIAQDCRPRNDYAHLNADGTLVPFEVEHHGPGLLGVASDGRTALGVIAGDRWGLATTDANGKNEVIITTDDHRIAESQFSPSGDSIVFHDISRTAPGLWVISASGQTSPHRVSPNATDGSMLWLDEDTIVFSRPEKGYVFGRLYQVPATGGEPTPLPDGPGLLIGTVPNAKALLRAERKDDGFHLFRQKVDGGRATPVLVGGAPFVFRADRSVSSSVSGRWLAWFEGNDACTLDLEKLKRACIPMPHLGQKAIALQPDAEGHLAVQVVRSAGQLYEVRGTFR